MIRTLAYLVVSMTGGAAALSWFEPDLPVREGTLSGGSPLRVQLVDISPETAGSKWMEIRVNHDTGVPSGSSPNIPLQANRPNVRYHFRIFPDGALEVGPAWRYQQPIPPDPQAIAVCLVGSQAEQQIPSRQWKAFMRLVQELQARCGISPSRIRLDPDSDPTKCPDLPAQTLALHDLLTSVGLAN